MFLGNLPALSSYHKKDLTQVYDSYWHRLRVYWNPRLVPVYQILVQQYVADTGSRYW